jgi:hypothetical protein
MTSIKELYRNRKRSIDGSPKIKIENSTYSQTDTTDSSSYDMDSAWKNRKFFGDRYNVGDSNESDSDEVQYLVNEWQKKRAVWRASWSVVDKSHVCEISCMQSSIESISDDYDLWGCKSSGRVHRCFKDDRCKWTLTSADFETVCIFSGRVIGKITETTPYKKADSSCGDVNYDSGADVIDDVDFNDDDVYELEQQLVPLSSTLSKTRGVSIDGTVFTGEIVGEGKEPLSDGVKRRGPKSGSKRSKQRKCFDLTNINDLIDEAKLVVNDLLYNSRTRIKLNTKTEAKCKSDAHTDATKYYKKCKNQGVLPIMQKVDAIYDCSYNKKRLYEILPYDNEKVMYYSNMIARMWRVIIKTPYCQGLDGEQVKEVRKKGGRDARSPQFHSREHAVACLYMMRKDYLLHLPDGKVILVFKKDEYLDKHLFDESDLKEVPISSSIIQADKMRGGKVKPYGKSDITDGRNNIKNSILSALPKIESMLKEEELIIQYIYNGRHNLNKSDTVTNT